jgi:NACalpha-BTF3-like transcription factor
MAERAIWDKLREIQSFLDDLNSRLVTLEAWVGKAFFTFPEKIEQLPLGSRWVLEIFPEEIEDWRRALRTIPLERLSERERSFLRSMDYYIVSEHKITLPQLIWLTILKRKAGGILPEIPLVTAPTIETHSSPSNPLERRFGMPRTDVERIMAHYGISREEAEKLIQEVMRVYGVSKEQATKALLPPRGAKVTGYSQSNQALFVCEQCGATFSTPQETCPICYGNVVMIE